MIKDRRKYLEEIKEKRKALLDFKEELILSEDEIKLCYEAKRELIWQYNMKEMTKSDFLIEIIGLDLEILENEYLLEESKYDIVLNNTRINELLLLDKINFTYLDETEQEACSKELVDYGTVYAILETDYIKKINTLERRYNRIISKEKKIYKKVLVEKKEELKKAEKLLEESRVPAIIYHLNDEKYKDMVEKRKELQKEETNDQCKLIKLKSKK